MFLNTSVLYFPISPVSYFIYFFSLMYFFYICCVYYYSCPQDHHVTPILSYPSWNSDVVTTLPQRRCWRCHNVVARLKMRNVPTSVSDVVTTSLSNVAKTLTQRWFNVATRLSTGFLGLFDEDYSDLFPFIKTRDSYKIAKWHQTHIVSL